jgi:cation-transporting ATPase I
MSAGLAAEPQIIHALPGRVRIHLPEWSGGRRHLESDLRRLPGVRRAQANPATGNVLVQFDPAVTGPQALLAALRREPDEPAGDVQPEQPAPPVIREGRGRRKRARIAVRGLDRDPQLARRIVDRLKRHPGVHASASPLTGRVLVEYDAHLTHLDDLLEDVTDLELPSLPNEDRPSHPLDPAPLFQSATRTAGAALGLSLLAVRRLLGTTGPMPGSRTASFTNAFITILRSFPTIRDGLRRLLGRDAADLTFSLGAALSLTVSSNPLGLAVTGGEALLLLREVLARRAAWRRYEERLGGAASAEPGAVIRLDGGERTPLAATVVEGTGTARGYNGLPITLQPGATIEPGSLLAGGPFVLQLHGGPSFTPEPRPAPPAPTVYNHYIRTLGPVSLGYAALTAILTRSPLRVFESLLLVNPRTAVIGMECANLAATWRVLRGGVTVVGTRHGRVIRLPDALLLDGPRVLTEGLELTSTVQLMEAISPTEIISLAGGVSIAAGSPWGNAFPQAGAADAEDGNFDGTVATASVGGTRYTLGPVSDPTAFPTAERLVNQGNYLLLLSKAGQHLGILSLRPRLAHGALALVRLCVQHRIEIGMLPGEDGTAARAVARRAGVELLESGSALSQIRERQASGKRVAFLSDSARGAEAFAACDLAIGLSAGRSARFPARADLLAPDLEAVAAILEAGARRDAAVRDSVGLSVIANAAGATWGLQGDPGIGRASFVMYLTALGALLNDWLRLQGGERRGSSLAHLVDPRPERWGHRSVETVLRVFHTSEEGLNSSEVAQRRRRSPIRVRRHSLLAAINGQMRSPVTKVLLAGAGVSVFMGEMLDAAIIAATVGINLVAGVWQERKVGQAVEALNRLNAASARVLRDRQPVVVPASEVVPGDVLVLAPGSRVAADARLFQAAGLEVDEAALTGESLPVAKGPDESIAANRVVLEGSDVVVGTGRAVVIAVGRHTRMGATAAALAVDEVQESPLGARLGQVLRLALPASLAGGVLAVGAGMFWGGSLTSQLPVGVSTTLSVIPEGLTLLAGMGESGVARRLAGRDALVRRLGAVEALGRVDVACADKTGTMTEGRLALRLVADPGSPAGPSGLRVGPAPSTEHTLESCATLGPDLCPVLRAAALASPHPEAADAAAHPTDVAVIRGACEAGLGNDLLAPRQAEASFDPSRAFHAALVGGRLYLKGAPETLAPRCTRVSEHGQVRPLDEEGRQALLARAHHFAERGLRVLMVAEGPGDVPVEDPVELTALGFVGIRDPLRPTVPEAVRRCQEAGVRVVMLTGDHPATARAIAREAGLLSDGDDAVVTGPEIAELHNGDLDRRLENARVIARATPLDKVRIVESLRRQGHTVAMTGDGVNDAPALRLADVGVAMGRHGTEVARQAADVVLADDDFATLVEALVEGRGFWQNMRKALGLLLGGNLGELGIIVGASAAGMGAPLNARQILVVNLITDALPALAVVLQRPEHRNLAALSREGVTALDRSLRLDVLRRGTATALPALAAYILARPALGAGGASSVAFASIVANQLSQTLEAGRVEGGLSRPVASAVAASAGLLVSTLALPPLRTLLGLTAPGLFGWALIGGSGLAAVALSHALEFLVAPARNRAAAPEANGTLRIYRAPDQTALTVLRNRFNLPPS